MPIHKLKIFTITSIVINVLLFIFKLYSGLKIESSSLVADSICSLIESTFLLIDLVSIVNDIKFFIYKKILLLSKFILIFTTLAVFIGGLEKAFISPLHIPHSNLIYGFALMSSVMSLIAKLWLCRRKDLYAKQYGSKTALNNIWNNSCNVIISLLSSLGVIGLIFSFPLADCVATVIIGTIMLRYTISVMHSKEL